MTNLSTSQKNEKLKELGYDIEGILKFPSTERFEFIRKNNKRFQDYAYIEPTNEEIEEFINRSYDLICL